MREIIIAPGQHYHIFNRGSHKQTIFLDNRDWARFLFLLIHLQSSTIFYNIGRHVSHFTKNVRPSGSNIFGVSKKNEKEIIKNRSVELINFALMPNHFHLTLYEKISGGIALYMQRVLGGYAKYFNTKYKKSGHVFQGPYKAVHIENNNQLLYLSAYIHRNPREITEWKNKEHSYPWSSYQDYTKKNRWGKLLKQNIIVEQFSGINEYKKFLETSIAKQLDEELLIDAS